MSLYRLPCLFLFHKLLDMSETSLIFDTSKHEWTMVRVAMVTLSLVTSCYQYHFLLDLIILVYFAFNIISPAFMTWFSTFCCFVTYMVLILIWQHNSPLWLDMQYLLHHIFHSEQVQTCFHRYHLIQLYALHQSPSLLFFYR